jgi:integrase
LAKYLTRREGLWHFARRVPTSLIALDKRGVVKQSTRVRVADDPRAIRASKVADRINGELEAYWSRLATGDATTAKGAYDEARRVARSFGFDYRPAAELATAPISEIVVRSEALVARGRVEDEKSFAALHGGVATPKIRLSDLFAEFGKVMRASLADMSKDQVRKWANPKKRALANLITVIGDKPISDITRSDALDFQSMWQDRVLDEGIEVGTANKDFGHISRMLRAVDRRHRLGLAPVFGDLRLEGETARSRAAFDVKFVQERIFAGGALNGLNDEARAIIYLIAETGLRLSEAVNLRRSTIMLAAGVPHVLVRPDGRRMKTTQSAREIPLVGAALLVMREHRDGFPRYQERAPSLSALVNKAFDSRGLRPTPQHSLYSLRHTFEDRLTAVEAPEKVIAALMGHKYDRPKYGAGPTLEQKAKWLKKIALKPPAGVDGAR